MIPGVVSREMFALGSAATTEAHRFIYDGSNGDLFYDSDSDGTGVNEEVKLARLNSGLDLSSDNLFVS